MQQATICLALCLHVLSGCAYVIALTVGMTGGLNLDDASSPHINDRIYVAGPMFGGILLHAHFEY